MKHLREMAPEAAIYTFLAKSVCSQDHEDAAGRVGKALAYAHPDDCSKAMSSWARTWIELEVIDHNEVVEIAKSTPPSQVSRILVSALDVTLQGFCATARSVEHLRVIQSAMPSPEYGRNGELRHIA